MVVTPALRGMLERSEELCRHIARGEFLMGNSESGCTYRAVADEIKSLTWWVAQLQVPDDALSHG